MGWKHMDLIESKQIGLGPVIKAIFVNLAGHANKQGEAIWPSKGTVAAEVECSRRMVNNAVDRLVAAGLLIERGRRAISGGGFTVEYGLGIAAIMALPDIKSEAERYAPSATRDEERYAPSATRGMHPVQPNLSLEPINQDKALSNDRSLSFGQNIIELFPETINAEPKRKAEGTRLPDDFEMPDEWLDWVVEERSWSPAQAREERDKFIDYWHAATGAHARKKDWYATWRNWCRNAKLQPARRIGI